MLLSTLSHLPRLRDKVPSESLLENLNKALLTIPTNSITATSKLTYAKAHTILEMLGYKMDSINEEQHHPWDRRLVTKIKRSRQHREVSQLSELQKGGQKKEIRLPKKYNRLSTAKTKAHSSGKLPKEIH